MGASFEQAVRGGGGAPLHSHPAEPVARPRAAGAPSLLRYAPALVLFAIVIADAMRSADSDLWSHIIFGRIVVSQHQLFFHAPFSYACPPGPRNWPNLEWLGGVVLAIVYDTAGVVGLKLGKFACVASLMVFVVLAEAESGASLKVQAVVLLLAAMALVAQMQFRPALATYAFFAALVAMLARESYGRRAPLWLAVPMMALWANLHGGFFVGLLALGLYTLVRGAQDVVEGKGIGNGLRLVALTTAAALATLLNPYGLRDWLTIVSYVRNPFTLGYISEFHPMLARVAELHYEHVPVFMFVYALAIIVALVVSFVLTPRTDDLALFAIAIVMSASALYAARNTALAVIACSPPLCRHAGLLIDRRRGSLKKSGIARVARPWPAIQAVVAIAAVAIALRTGLLSGRLPAAQVRPVGALAYMHERGLHGNTLCAFAWADYFIWHRTPHSKIFIESLFEAYYPQKVQDDYLDFERGDSHAGSVLNSYPHDFVLVPTQLGTAKFMETRGDWKLIYRDPVSSLYARADAPAAHLAGVPELRETAPPSFFP